MSASSSATNISRAPREQPATTELAADAQHLVWSEEEVAEFASILPLRHLNSETDKYREMIKEAYASAASVETVDKLVDDEKIETVDVADGANVASSGKDSDFRSMVFAIVRRKYGKSAAIPGSSATSVASARLVIASDDANDFVNVLKSVNPSEFKHKETIISSITEHTELKSADSPEPIEPTKSVKSAEPTKFDPKTIGLYTTINPLSHALAQAGANYDSARLVHYTKRQMKKCNNAKDAKDAVAAGLAECHSHGKPSSYKTWLHRSVAENYYFDLDIDILKDDHIAHLNIFNQFHNENLWSAVVVCVQTRGGYHIVLDRTQMSSTQITHLFSWSRTCKAPPPPAPISAEPTSSSLSAPNTIDSGKQAKPPRTPRNERRKLKAEEQKLEKLAAAETTEIADGDKKAKLKNDKMLAVKSLAVLVSWVTVNKASQLPIPGTWQGGYPCRMIDFCQYVVDTWPTETSVASTSTSTSSAETTATAVSL